MKLLITGGAGYIGSHTVRYVQDHGHEVVVLDNFSSGNKWSIKNCEILEVDLLDQEKLAKLLKDRSFDGVIHFAAKSLIGESIKNPNLYYRNNVIGTLNLINEMSKNNINNLIFSSSAAIFGNPSKNKISEDHSKKPINPYGKSKLIIENILQDICNAKKFNSICLRYFNAAGAHSSGQIGEAHEPETHLIPNVLMSAKSNKGNFKVFGNKYDTHDGTCVRDYVHVDDLAQAHLLGLNYLKKREGFSAFNLGNGNGFSILDVIKSCERITKKSLRYQFDLPRKGDPAILIAESSLAMKNLGWEPKFSNLDDIISSAWKWHNS